MNCRTSRSRTSRGSALPVSLPPVGRFELPALQGAAACAIAFGTEMKPRTKRVLFCVGLAIYLGAYVVARVNGELIHRHTWTNGWSKHWVVPGGTDGEAHLAFAALVQSADPSDVETQERMFKAVDRIDRRRRVLRCIFIPLVVAESAGHWVTKPRV